jgi:RND family efflux transporter MFP subunit
VVNPAEILYVVADLSQVWLDIAVYDKDLEKIKEGQIVNFRSDSVPGVIFTGTINYIQPAAGDATKTFLARVVLPNPQLVLKPGMFGQAEILAKANAPLPYLPDRSLQKYRNENFVFVQLTDGSFEKHVVVLGNRVDDGYLIVSGITPGEQVVGSGSFKLKSELMKSEIGQE